MRTLGNFLIFLTAILVGCAAIRAGLPRYPVAVVESKLRWWEQHGEEYDTVFFGSSCVHRQIVPAVFDEITRQAGVPTRSYNFGVDGTRPPEDLYLFEEVLRTRKTPFKYVFFEANPINFHLDQDKANTIRGIYWHDWKRMIILARGAFIPEKKRSNLRGHYRAFQNGWKNFHGHIPLWAKRTANIGRGAEFLRTFVFATRPENVDHAAMGGGQDGFLEIARAQTMTPSEAAQYEPEVQKRRAEPAKPAKGSAESQDLTVKKRRLIEKAGGKMILINSPTTSAKYFAYGGDDPPLTLNFSSVEKYPELFLPEYRLDTYHLNTAGAKIYSQLVAKEFVEALQR